MSSHGISERKSEIAGRVSWDPPRTHRGSGQKKGDRRRERETYDALIYVIFARQSVTRRRAEKSTARGIMREKRQACDVHYANRSNPDGKVIEKGEMTAGVL